MPPRISGQDTEITVSVDNEAVQNITAVRSFDFTWKFQTKSEEYLGETAPRFDEFFGGVSGRIEVDLEGPEALAFAEAVKARAQTRTISTRIGIKSTLQFPSGDRVIINVPDAYFSDIPVTAGGRTEYLKTTLSYEASEAQIVSR